MFFPELSPAFEQMVAELDGTKVAVLGHMRPDGDCIGSQIALCRALRRKRIDAVCVNPDEVPRRLAFLVDDTPFYPASQWSESGRLAMATDCSDPGRFGPILGKRFPAIFANIDHHISNTLYGERNFIESNAAATAEILGGMFLDLGWTIDRAAAQALFVGIATDTGQFRFPSTTRRVFSISGRLLDHGANPSDASIELYERERLSKMKLLQRYLASLSAFSRKPGPAARTPRGSSITPARSTRPSWPCFSKNVRTESKPASAARIAVTASIKSPGNSAAEATPARPVSIVIYR